MTNRRRPDRRGGGSPPGRLRIVAGNWRSRLLPIADVPGLRPTPQRVRETLFNWLRPTIQGARCLDLFAGTGALGFEALSRGAKKVTFVEQSKDAAAVLRSNIEKLAAKGATVIQGGALEFLEKAPTEHFDLVFLDPPFADDLLQTVTRLLTKNGWLLPGARIYIEQRSDQALPELPLKFALLRDKTAGQVRYALLGAAESELSRERK